MPQRTKTQLPTCHRTGLNQLNSTKTHDKARSLRFAAFRGSNPGGDIPVTNGDKLGGLLFPPKSAPVTSGR